MTRIAIKSLPFSHLRAARMCATLILVVFAALPFGTIYPVSAQSSENFLEVPLKNKTLTFDLRSIQFIGEPTKFSVVSTMIDNPDVMRFHLHSLEVLWHYCSGPDGEYSAPTDLFVLGVPDMPVGKIEVKGTQARKTVSWSAPYQRLKWSNGSHGRESVECWGGNPSNGNEWYTDRRFVIMNGTRLKYLYDCKRGLMGSFFNEKDDASMVVLFPIRKGTGFADDYDALCRKVTGKPPYPLD